SSQSVLIRSELRRMAHAGLVSYVPTNLGWECEEMVREPLARKHRRMGGTQATVHNHILDKKSVL
nr:hypothetical protein [Tanacetum cinerariifolium]